MERNVTNMEVRETKPLSTWRFIMGFFVFLYKTAIRP